MRPPSIIFWCYMFLRVASSPESFEHSTNDDEQSDNSPMRYDLLVNSTRDRGDEMEPMQYDLRENSTKNDEVQYESFINSTKNDLKDDFLWSYKYAYGGYIKNCVVNNSQVVKNPGYSTEDDDKNNCTFQEIETCVTLSLNYKTGFHSNKTTTLIVPNEACNNGTCIQRCCFRDYRLTFQGDCIPTVNGTPCVASVYKYDNDSENKTFDEPFPMTVRDPCAQQGLRRRLLDPDQYTFLENGTLVHHSLGYQKALIPPKAYCLAVLFSKQKIYDVIVCNDEKYSIIYISAYLLVSLPFFLLTFIVYSILPELQNMHGYTLRALIASFFVSYMIIPIGQLIFGKVRSGYCITLAYILYFSSLSGYFWINVTCFDIWWTFRGIRSNRTNIKYHEKKKFAIYSIYAWGIPFIFTVVCAIMDYAPVPKNWIRPEMCNKTFWFGGVEARIIYFYISMGAIVISNIYFFIATTVTIMYQDIRTAYQLRNSESRCQDKNKKRFVKLTRYLKLFIVMGITRVTDVIIVFPPNNYTLRKIWNFADMLNTFQGVVIFIIFVCKKRILRLLLKRFGCQNRGTFCKISRNDDCPITNTSGSGTGTETETVFMREISPSNQQTNHRAKSD